jgi:hypothetical protein
MPADMDVGAERTNGFVTMNISSISGSGSASGALAFMPNWGPGISSVPSVSSNADPAASDELTRATIDPAGQIRAAIECIHLECERTLFRRHISDESVENLHDANEEIEQAAYALLEHGSGSFLTQTNISPDTAFALLF